MSMLRSASYALCALAFAGVCAVCAIGGQKSALAAPAPAAPAPILFVSDTKANTIAVFSLPGLALKRMITAGLSQPQGLCSTASGNIWATNGGKQIVEYSRSGTVPIETLTDPTGNPFSCSVDEVAVGNITNNSGPGETYVYYNGGQGPSYDLKGLYYVDGIAYDPGNLYIVGRTQIKTFVLAELPAGSTTIKAIPVKGGSIIHHPGMLQWDAHDNYLAVGDRSCGNPKTTCVYHVTLHASKSGLIGTISGKTTLKAYNGQAICDMAQGVIYQSGSVTYLAGGDDESSCGRAAMTSVNQWAFPAGGPPINNNHSIPLTNPFGTAISR